MRLIPPALRPDSHTHSVDFLARYLRENQDVDRQLLVYAVCPAPAARKVVAPAQDPATRSTLAEQRTSSSATVSGYADYMQSGNQTKEFTANAEPLAYNASGTDVIMLVSAAVASLPKKRGRDALEMRLGVEDQPLTLAEIGAEWSVSAERVRQIQERAFRRLAARARYEGTPGAALKKLLDPACASSEAIAMWLLSTVRSDFVIPPGLAAKFILRTAGFPNEKVVEIAARLSTIS